MKPHSPQPHHSKSTHSRSPKKPGKKKVGSDQESHSSKPGSKRQSRSDTELYKSTSTTTARAPQRRRRSNSAAVVRTNYAGPIFNNAPEPSSLPIPNFLPPRPRTTSFHTIGEHKQHDQPQQFPPKMVTAHDQQDPSLIELQQRLSSMLKLV